MTLGEYLKNYRTKHALTMQDIADRSGLSKGYVSMLERGQHPQSKRKLTPSLETYQKIAVATNVELDVLLALLSDQDVIVNSTTSSPVEPEEIPEHITLFEKLNDEGQEMTIEYMKFLISQGYIKSNTAELVEAE